MTLLEHIRSKKITFQEIAENIGINRVTFSKYEKHGTLHDLSVKQANKMCDFIGISKQEFIKGNIKPLKGRR